MSWNTGSISEALLGVPVLRGVTNIMERCDVTGHYRMLWKHYGAFTERYGTVMENIDFAHH